MFSRTMMSVAVLVASAGAAHAQMSTAFTYQGRLTANGQPANGVYDISFVLYTSAAGLFSVGDPWVVQDVQVTDGLFTTTVDFGTNFLGDDRWMSINIRPGAQTGAFTPLSPRQRVTAAPYALTARSIAVPMTRGGTTHPDLFGPQALIHMVQNGTAPAVMGESTNTGPGVRGLNNGGGRGVEGETGGSGPGVAGINTSTVGSFAGVYGESASTSGKGVYGRAIAATGTTSAGVYGVNDSVGQSSSGVRGMAMGGGDNMTFGVFGQSTSSTEGVGVHGQGRFGVYGLGTSGGIDAKGVYGSTSQTDGVGVHGRATGGGGSSTGIWGEAAGSAAWAGFFSGDVRVAGLMWANEKNFLIDNPANPANEFLIHACIESDERRNLYDGVATLDAHGAATVQMPGWFDKLNADYRYQLTCIGGSAPVYIAREIRGNSFAIAGGTPGLKVSWQVTGVRIDPDARSRPFQAVRAKQPEDHGRFVNPEAYGLPSNRTIGRMPSPLLVPSRPVGVDAAAKADAAAREAASNPAR